MRIVWGLTTHPINPLLSPGGSSGGEGALLALCGSMVGFLSQDALTVGGWSRHRHGRQCTDAGGFPFVVLPLRLGEQLRAVHDSPDNETSAMPWHHELPRWTWFTGIHHGSNDPKLRRHPGGHQGPRQWERGGQGSEPSGPAVAGRNVSVRGEKGGITLWRHV